MTKYTDQHGSTYAAQDGKPWRCDGCAHKPGTKACRSAPPCSPGLRPQDRRDIIWVLQT